MSFINLDIPGWTTTTLGKSNALKLADGVDSFLFHYKSIDPYKENFAFSATIEVVDVSGVDYQTGYGLMAVDTVAKTSSDDRYRNHALVGRFRTPEGLNYGLGLRIVGGYTSPEAAFQPRRRRLDPSRLFKAQYTVDEISIGDRHQFRLAKTDQGIEASMITPEGTETIHFPGCDFLLRQDPSSIYVGFALGGDIGLKITDFHFETFPGKLSHTPKKVIGHYFPDYPFRHNIFDGITRLETRSPRTIRITPGDSPQRLESALLSARPGQEIILSDGVYCGGPYYIPKSCSGTKSHPVVLRAEHPGKAILEGGDISTHLPLMVLHADAWKVDGLVFRHAPSSGLMLCGSHHFISQCEACENGDTGFLMCAFPGSSKREWPAHNTFEHCISHDNCDSVRRNADGFGAKLSIGEGNSFHACKAFHNIDDGFDCYTKDIIGPISPVLFKDCEAWNNGWLSGEKKPKEAKRSGSGFKLGGEQIKVPHVLVNCTSHHNARRGFDNNSNPAPILKECREWKNLLKS